MVIPRWSAFRLAFALPGALADTDGGPYLPVWPRAKLRTSGYDGTIVLPQPFTFPAVITVNGGLTNAAEGTMHHWFLSQRTENEARQPLLLRQEDRTRSGTVTLRLTSQASKLVPIGQATTEDSIRKLFKNTYLYAQRQGDKAIQYIDMTTAILGLGL